MNHASSPNTAVRLAAMAIAAISVVGSAVLATSALNDAKRYGDINRSAHTVHAALEQLEAYTIQADVGESPNQERLDETLDQIRDNIDNALVAHNEDDRIELKRATQEFVTQSVTRVNLVDRAGVSYSEYMQPVGSLARPTVPHQQYDELDLVSEFSAIQAHERALRYLAGAGVAAALSFSLVIFVESRARTGRAADRARFELNEQYREIIETSSIHIYVVKPDGRILMASPAVERVLGAVPENISDVLDRLRPEDAQMVRSFLSPSANTTFKTTTTYAVLTKDWYEVTVVNCLDKPAIAGFVVSGREITTQVMLQDQLRTQVATDDLTRLPNRRALTQLLSQALEHYKIEPSV